MNELESRRRAKAPTTEQVIVSVARGGFVLTWNQAVPDHGMSPAVNGLPFPGYVTGKQAVCTSIDGLFELLRELLST